MICLESFANVSPAREQPRHGCLDEQFNDLLRSHVTRFESPVLAWPARGQPCHGYPNEQFNDLLRSKACLGSGK